MNIKTEASLSLKLEQRLRLSRLYSIHKKNILKVTTAYMPYKKHFFPFRLQMVLS